MFGKVVHGHLDGTALHLAAVDLAAGLPFNVLAGVLEDVAIAKVPVVHFATGPSEDVNGKGSHNEAKEGLGSLAQATWAALLALRR